MSALSIVIAKLLATSGVTGIVSGDGIYPITAPQTTPPPYLVVSLASGNDEQLLTGAAKLYSARIQVDCLATTALGAMDLGDAVGTALEDVVKETISGSTVDIMRDGIDHSDFSDDRTVFRRVMGFRVNWK